VIEARADHRKHGRDVSTMTQQLSLCRDAA